MRFSLKIIAKFIKNYKIKENNNFIFNYYILKQKNYFFFFKND